MFVRRLPRFAISALVVLAGCSSAAVGSTSGPAETGTSDPTTAAVAAPASVTAPTTSPPSTLAQVPDITLAPVPVTDPPAPTVPPSREAAPATLPPVVIEASGRTSGPATQVAQQRLLDLHFWLSGPDGSFGPTTEQAVMAFQGYSGLPVSGSIDEATAAALAAVTMKPAGTSVEELAEVDKTRQILTIHQDMKVVWIFHVSTGSEKAFAADSNLTGEDVSGDAITYSGEWKMNRQRPDGWWEGDLGKIYRPKYFKGGEAIHGAPKVPNYPASHGCVRVSVAAMDEIWAEGLLPLGTPVHVFGDWVAPA